MIFPLVPQVRVRTPWALAAFAAVVARSLRGPEASLNSIAIIGAPAANVCDAVQCDDVQR